MNMIKLIIIILTGIFLSGCQSTIHDRENVFINIFAGVPSQIGLNAAHAGELDYMVSWNGKKKIYEINGEKFIQLPVEVWKRDYDWINTHRSRFRYQEVKGDFGKVWMKIDCQNVQYTDFYEVSAKITDEPQNLKHAKVKELSGLRYGERTKWEWENNYFNRQLLYTKRESWGYWIAPLSIPGYILDVPITLTCSLALDAFYIVTFPVFWRLYTGKQEWR
ncbi:MAG: hypothetical protein E7058_04335 [Lentisphaerae bacterium]|nr:hypothetical protein [Lentisphaerota bacterium]